MPQAGVGVTGERVEDGGAAGVFTLYSREYCHLCHDMLAQLNAMRSIRPFDLLVVDVDSDARLEAQFGELVPVLVHQERELARYHLDIPALEAYLARIPRAAA